VYTPNSFLVFMFVLYLVKTSDASERTLRRRPLPVRLVTEPESRNVLITYFKFWHFDLYQKIYELTFYLQKLWIYINFL